MRGRSSWTARGCNCRWWGTSSCASGWRNSVAPWRRCWRAASPWCPHSRFRPAPWESRGRPPPSKTPPGAARRVREGQSLHGALAATGVVPDLVTGMVEVGESTGALPHMLNSVAEFYEEELNVHLCSLLALVEPLLLLGVAGTVLVILIALYLPIFSVGPLVR